MSINSKCDNNHSGDFLGAILSSFDVNQDPAQLKKSGMAKKITTTPYSQNWPGHLTEHLPRNKRCKNEKCKCKQKSNRAFECWQCGAEFPTTKNAKRKYFSKNNPAPEGAKKKRRKKNALARANKSPVSPRSLAMIGSPAPKKTPNVAACQNEPIDNGISHGDLMFSSLFDEPLPESNNIPAANIESLPVRPLTRGDSLTPLSEIEPEFNYDSIPIPGLDSYQNMYDSDGGIDLGPDALFSDCIDFELTV